MKNLFDDLTRILASTLSRREASKLLLGGLTGSYLVRGSGASILPSLLPGRADASLIKANGTAPQPCSARNCRPLSQHIDIDRICSYIPQDDGNPDRVDNRDTCCPEGFKSCLDNEGVETSSCCRKPQDRCCLTDPATNGFTCCDVATSCCCPREDGSFVCVVAPTLTSITHMAGPPVQLTIEFAVISPVSFEFIKTENTDVSFSILEGKLIFHAIKVDQRIPSRFVVRVCNPCGTQRCCIIGDPVITQFQIPEGETRIRESFTDIPAAEHFVTIQNGHPGLRKLYVNVNGKRAAYLRLGPKEIHNLDIASYMMASNNIVTLTGQGRPGASALVLIADAPSEKTLSAADTSKHQPLVEWEPGLWQPGVNLHWGGGGTE